MRDINSLILFYKYKARTGVDDTCPMGKLLTMGTFFQGAFDNENSFFPSVNSICQQTFNSASIFSGKKDMGSRLDKLLS